MTDERLSLREAGDRLVSSGHTGKVAKLDADSITNRSRRKQAREEPEERYDDNDEAGYEDDEGQDTSSRRDDDGDEYDEETPDAEDDDDVDDDFDEGESDESRAQSDDAKSYEVKVDGKTEKVSLKELTAGYQRNRDYQHKTQALAQRRRELDTGHGQVAQQYQQRMHVLQGVFGKVRDLLVGDVNSAEMQRMRTEDPNGWLVQRQAMQDRIDSINGVLGQIQGEQENYQRQLAQHNHTAFAQAVAQETEIVKQYISDWDTEGKQRLSKYLTDFGFSDQELATIADARMLRIAEKARLYDALMQERSKAPEKRKRKEPPRQTKSKGGNLQRKPTKRSEQRSEFTRAKRRAAKTGNMRDAGKAIERML